MIGNDIVDITEALKTSNWQRPRYLDKLFTAKEQEYILQSEDASLMVWRLWSMKEAAYKLYIQQHPKRFYYPKAFECSLQEENGTVIFQDFKCYVNTIITSDYILSEARLYKTDCTSEVMVFKTKDINIQSKRLKQTLIQSASKAYQTKPENLKIQKNVFKIPKLVIDDMAIPISLTHHGRFGAFVF